MVLVTGAGSGIGRATAHLFADEGARVAVTDLDAASADDVAAEITAAGGDARAWALDVTDAAAVQGVVADVAAWGGGLDVLVNNAGASVGHPIDHDDFEEAWDFGIDLLLTSLTRTIRAALPHLRQAAAGRIVNIS